jgi:prepilin peptidase CpaA
MDYLSDAPFHSLELIFSASFPLSLLVAAGTDLGQFRISNFIIILVLAGFAPVAVLAGYDLTDWLIHGATALGLLAAGGTLFALGLWGGGDAKLLTAAGLWLGPQPLPRFLLIMSLAGLVLALFALALRLIPVSARHPDNWHRRFVASGQIPYGAAIAAAGLDWWLSAAAHLA